MPSSTKFSHDYAVPLIGLFSVAAVGACIWEGFNLVSTHNHRVELERQQHEAARDMVGRALAQRLTNEKVRVAVEIRAHQELLFQLALPWGADNVQHNAQVIVKYSRLNFTDKILSSECVVNSGSGEAEVGTVARSDVRFADAQTMEPKPETPEIFHFCVSGRLGAAYLPKSVND
jgi:hypothetical protein